VELKYDNLPCSLLYANEISYHNTFFIVVINLHMSNQMNLIYCDGFLRSALSRRGRGPVLSLCTPPQWRVWITWSNWGTSVKLVYSEICWCATDRVLYM